MNDIRAFVGHSFIEDDATLVAKFLHYFRTISAMHPTFSWSHAESAEPKLLAEKVLALIEDKNTFIGICTRKELATELDALSVPYFQRSCFTGKSEDFVWKTSDWIIQEIGLAIGRKMEVILLIEEGVRKPGGLQGDVEYISFDREAPRKVVR